MRSPRPGRYRPLFAVLVLAAAAAVSAGGEGRPPATSAPPSADELSARHCTAVGGVAAIERHRSMYVKGVVTVPGKGLQGEIEQYTAAPDRFQTRYSVPGLAEFTNGHDGRVAWRVDGGGRARVIDGRERKDLLLSADFYAELNYKTSYSVRETVGHAKHAGKDCYQVRLVTDYGEEVMQYFDVESGLLVGRESWYGKPGEAVKQTQSVLGYQKIGGRLVATEFREAFGDSEERVKLEVVRFDDVDDKVFELPEPVRRVLAQRDPRPAAPK